MRVCSDVGSGEGFGSELWSRVERLLCVISALGPAESCRAELSAHASLLPPFRGAYASPYVNPGEYKLGGPHPGGSHHQPVAWAPRQKSNLTERAEMQQQLREQTDRSLFPPNHCYLLQNLIFCLPNPVLKFFK